MLKKVLPKLTKKLKKAPLNIKHLNRFNLSELDLEILIANGYPIFIENNYIYLKTAINKVYEQTFCLVDIEATNSDIKKGQIIELAAIKIKNNVIIETFYSLVYSRKVPKIITQITGILEEELLNAPKIEKVLQEFKLFLEDDVFVAHNVNFDYNFISASLKKYYLGELYNRKICSVEFAKKTIISEKYGLKSLKKLLGINNTHHRAYEDVASLVEIFKVSLSKINQKVTTEALIDFVEGKNG